MLSSIASCRPPRKPGPVKLRRNDIALRWGNSEENIRPVLEEACHKYAQLAAVSPLIKRCLADTLVSEAIEAKGADRLLHLSQKRDRYSGRYSHYGYRVVKQAADLMTELGLHDFTLGEFDYSRRTGNESTVRITQDALDWVLPLIDIDGEQTPFPECIVLKSRQDKNTLLDYEDFTQTIEMRRQVNRINESITSQVLFDANGRQLQARPGSRQFLDDFETGGGYFHPLQNTPSVDRLSG